MTAIETGAKETTTSTTLAGVVDAATTLARESGRSDLTGRLDHTAERLSDPRVRVVVVGEFKQGKSALVNALVNAPVCPVDDVVGTAVPTIVEHGDAPSARLVTSGRVDGELHFTSVEFDSLDRHVADGPGSEEGSRLLRAEVKLPRQLLAEGLVLVDTPGVGRGGSVHAASTLAMLPTADAVLMLSDASQEYTGPELGFLEQALTLCPTVACVLSKRDLQPYWRDISDANRRHLDKAGLDLPLIPVSSVLRRHAVNAHDKELNVESGFPALLGYLRTQVIGRAEALAQRSVAHDVGQVTADLVLAMNAELETLRDPARAEGLMQELHDAQNAAAALKERSARWQQTLNDGTADLLSDIEYDLRDRLRRVTKEAEDLLDDCDPGEVWDEFGEWLAGSVAQAVGDNFVWAHQRSEWLAETVALHFTDDSDIPMPEFKVSDTDGVLDPIRPLEKVESGHVALPQKLIIGMRGSYGGVLMFGLLTGLAGMALVNPISVAAGLLMGTSTYRTDSKTRLNRRRQEGKIAVRRLIDEATFQVGKESRDRMRGVQRVLRDHFTNIATEMQRSLQESLKSAKEGATLDEAQREDRIAVLTRQLQVANNLAQMAQDLKPDQPAGVGTRR